MADTVERLILQVQGADDVQRLKDELKQQEAALRRVAAATGAATAAEAAQDAGVRLLADDVQNLRKKLEDADKATGRARNGMAGMGQSMLQSGRIIQDFAQGGIGGILNNVEGLAQALGGGPGLAGALTALGVAAFVLGPHLKTLATSLGLFGDQSKVVKDDVAELEKQIEALEKNPAKLTIESEQLDDAKQKLKEVKEALAALEAAQKSRSYYEKESGASVTETLAETEGGEAALKNRLVASATARNIAADKEGHIAGAAQDKAEAERQIKLGKEMLESAHSVEEAETLRAQVNAAQAARTDAIERDAAARRKARDQAREEVGTALGGAKEGKVPQQKALAAQLRGIGDEGNARAIEASSPQRLEELDQIEYGVQSDIDRMAEARKANAEKRRKRQRELEEQGRAADEDDNEKEAARHKQEDEEKRALDLRLKNAGEQDDAQGKAAEKAAKQSGLVPRAAFRQGQLIAQGASPEQAQQQTAIEADRIIARANPQMPKEERQGVARAVASQGGEQLQQQFAREAGATFGATGNAMEETQMAMARTLQVLSNAAAQMQGLRGQARALGQQANQVGRMFDRGNGSHLNGGRP